MGNAQAGRSLSAGGRRGLDISYGNGLINIKVADVGTTDWKREMRPLDRDYRSVLP